jgi:hypothetical protein
MVFAQSHKTDDYAMVCQVLSILRSHTEHEDMLCVLCTGGQDSTDMFHKYTNNPLGNRFTTAAL